MSATRKTRPDILGPREADFYAAADAAYYAARAAQVERLIQLIEENER